MEEESLCLLAEPPFIDLNELVVFPCAHSLVACGAVDAQEILDAGQDVRGWFSESVVDAAPYDFKWASSDLISAASR